MKVRLANTDALSGGLFDDASNTGTKARLDYQQ
jgi:hypothetical protein